MRRTTLALVVAIVLPLSACGGGKSASAGSSPTAPATAPADAPAAIAEIKVNFSKFFGPGTVAAHEPYLEDGDSLVPTMTQAAKSPQSQTTTTTVTSVTFTSSTTANVKYDLSIAGNKVLTNADGQVVLQNGTWKVAKFTFCQLLKLGSGGTPVAGCT